MARENPSGPEGSSGKRQTICAAGVPATDYREDKVVFLSGSCQRRWKEKHSMGHIALYREWRPKTFDEVVEQSHTVAALRQAVLSGKIAHAYLFSGTRGTGKTTMAQVFSRAINCLSPVNGNPCNQCPVCTGILNGSILDVIEMDAASNNSVDTIRRLCDEIVFTPSVAKFKVYIIDEVHMLSTGAFNALLKTLEEPPAHAVFILATTEQHRIPATILSRCQRYEFRRIPVASIVDRLRRIADTDGVSITEDALKSIAQFADGALRDAISLLDQAKGSFQGTIEKEDILSLVGVVNDDFMNQMALAIVNKDADHAMRLVEEFILDGRDVIRFTMDLAAYFRNVMVCKVSKKPEDLIYSPARTIDGMKKIAAFLPLDSILSLIRELSSLVSDLRWSLNTRITFEIAVIRLMEMPELKANGGIIDASSGPKVPVRDISVKPPEAVVPSVESIPAVTDTTSVDLPAEEAISDDLPAEEDPLEFPFPDDPPAEAEEDPFLSESSQILSEPSQIEDVIEQEELPVEKTPLAVVDIEKIWPDILDSIISIGQMTVYLFLLPAKPILKDGVLHILFMDKDLVNYTELSKKHNLQIISQAILQSTGILYSILPELQSEAEKRDKEASPAEAGQPDIKKQTTPASPGGPGPSGLESLRMSAEELGISFYMEE